MGTKVSDARTGAARRRSQARRELAAGGYGQANQRAPADEKRLRRARDVARRSIVDASERQRHALDLAFLQAIGAAVRLVAPFLVSLLRNDLAELDRLARTIAPSNRWLDALCEAGNSVVGFADATDVIRRLHGSASIDSNTETGPGTCVWDGSATKIVVVRHSLEVEVRVGTMRFETRLGMLHIEMKRGLPETLATRLRRLACREHRRPRVAARTGLDDRRP